MTTYYQEFDGQYTIDSSNDGMQVGASAGNVGHETNHIEGVCEDVQICIRALTGDSDTCVYDRSTGKVTITLDNAATLEFTDTDLAGILGYSSTSYASATTFVAERSPRQVWRPSKAASDYPNNINIIWEPKSTSQIVLAEDGTVFTLQGNLLYDGYIAYSLLPEADVITPNTGTIHKDLQQWFEDIIHVTKSVRLYPDINSSHYLTCYIGQGEEVGSFTEFKSRHISSYNGLWNVEIPLIKSV